MKNFIGSICLFLIAVSGYCLDKIGNVVSSDGGLKAIGADQNERILAKNSDLFAGDTLVTDQNGKGQVKFTDGTTVLLIPGTQYSVDDYASGEKKNVYLATLVGGGIQVSTGLIAKKNPENFVIGTPNATIGVRGTVFAARVVGNDVFVGPSSGKIYVKNDGGSLDLESGTSNQYARVSSMNSAPEALASKPNALDFSQVGSSGISGNAGTAAVSGGMMSTNQFAWGVGIGGAVIIGTVVGVVVSAATQSQPSTTQTPVAEGQRH